LRARPERNDMMFQLGSCALFAAAGRIGELLIWAGVMILALMLLGSAILWLRGRLFAHPARGEGDGGFTINQLEDLHRSGQLSEAEFRRLRRASLGLGIPKAQKNNSSSSPPCPDDDGKDSRVPGPPRADADEAGTDNP